MAALAVRPSALQMLRCTAPPAHVPPPRYVTSMATVLSAKLFRAGFSSSWLSLRGRGGLGTNQETLHPHQQGRRSHLVPMSMGDAPLTLGICRLVDSFKAEGGTAPRVRGRWRPERLAADGTLRQRLFPMRT